MPDTLEVPDEVRDLDPRYGWSSEGYVATDGPYAEAKEQLAGFFIIDCDSRQRAEQIAERFAGPGGVVELRPAMWPSNDDE